VTNGERAPDPWDEETLEGGTANRGLVVRVGDTVRRPQRAGAAATHALLRRLEDVGFAGAPRFLGVDAEGREMLSYIEGETVLPPLPEWGLTDEALDSVADLLRAFHDATAGFPAAQHEWTTAVPFDFRSGDVVSHNDLNLDNVVFRDGRAVALIDFDLSSPGSRVWDVAGAIRLWAPLRPDDDIADSRRGRNLPRLRRFVDAYRLEPHDRSRVVDAVLTTHDWIYQIVRSAAADGNRGFAEYWQRGGAGRAARNGEWLLSQREALEEALR
jgi:aminoglycoside phosphotransferase (APT) family kinase protein